MLGFASAGDDQSETSSASEFNPGKVFDQKLDALAPAPLIALQPPGHMKRFSRIFQQAVAAGRTFSAEDDRAQLRAALPQQAATDMAAGKYLDEADPDRRKHEARSGVILAERSRLLDEPGEVRR